MHLSNINATQPVGQMRLEAPRRPAIDADEGFVPAPISARRNDCSPARGTQDAVGKLGAYASVMRRRATFLKPFPDRFRAIRNNLF